MSERTQNEQTILEEALTFASARDRAAYVRAACGDDAALRAKIEWLVQAHEAAGSFLADRTAASGAGSEVLGVQVGSYKLLRRIGEGGCGVVYLAEQEQPVRRLVAVKIIKLGMDTAHVVARFEAERQALALMDHPHIAKVLDAGTTSTGRPYFVMDLVQGTRITEYCGQKNVPVSKLLKLFIEVCRAVQHAHQKGIIHRDLKPSNILVTDQDGVAVPKIIDFGIAKATAGQKLTDRTLFTAFEQFLGTPAYLSPEQAGLSSVDIDTRSDIYSLGVLLYELLTGHTPFDAVELLTLGLDELRRVIREKEPPRPSTRLAQTLAATKKRPPASRETPQTEPDLNRRRLQETLRRVRGDLDWIVLKCLEKDRALRYETANGLAADVQRHLDQEAVVARPPSTWYRSQKLVRRHKWAVAAGAAVLACLVLGVALASWQALRATQARREADAHDQEARHLLYIANMNLAVPAWEQNNVERVRELLKETAGSPERSFEWSYWQHQVHLPIHALRGTPGAITALAVSPDGRRIVSGSDARMALVWDVITGQEIFRFEADVDGVRSVAFSPDGTQYVLGGKDRTRIREAATGKELFALSSDSTGSWCVAYSPNGQRIATCNWGGTVKIWDSTTGTALLTLQGHNTPVWSVAFSPDNRKIVTGSRDATAKVWDATTGQALLTLIGHTDGVSSVAFFPDGQRIVTASGTPLSNETTGDHTAKVWDATRGELLFTLAGHSLMVTSVAVSFDGRRIVTASDDKTARVWNADNGALLSILTGHDDRVACVAFVPDGQRIVTGSYDRTVKVWDALTGKDGMVLRGHENDVYTVAISPDGQRVVTGGLDQSVRVWDIATGRELPLLRAPTGPVNCVTFSPDGHRLATGSGHRARLWDVATNRPLRMFDGHRDDVYAVAFSPENRRLVTGSEDRTAKVWSVDSGAELQTLLGHTAVIWSAAFSPDGRSIATGSGDGTAKLWAAETGKELHTLKGHESFVTAVAFSPDGAQVVTCSGDRTARLWDAATGRELRRFKGHGGILYTVSFLAGSERIVTGCFDGTAKVWDTSTGKELLTLKGHDAAIRSLAVSRDGSRIVTGSWDHTARIWQAATVQQVATWEREERMESHPPP